MTLNIKIDSWESLSNEVRSFINFFMKRAKLYFNENYNYDGDQINDSVSGNIMLPIRAIASSASPITDTSVQDPRYSEYYGDSNKVFFVNLPFTTTPTTASGEPRSIYDLYELHLSDHIFVNLHLTNFSLKTCYSTINLLCKAFDKVAATCGGNARSFYSESYLRVEAIACICDNCVLTPKVDGESVPEESTYSLSNVASGGKHYSKVSIEYPNTYDYRFKLKTTPFSVNFTGGPANTTVSGLYYKIGFISLDDNVSISSIKQTLLSQKLNIIKFNVGKFNQSLNNYSGGFDDSYVPQVYLSPAEDGASSELKFFIESTEFAASQEYEYNQYGLIRKLDKTNCCPIIPYIIIPIQYTGSTSTPQGLMFAQLFNSSNNEVTLEELGSYLNSESWTFADSDDDLTLTISELTD